MITDTGTVTETPAGTSLRREARVWGPLALLATICLSGATLLVLVFHRAYSAPPRYDLFWLGMACMFVPLWATALSARMAKPVVLASIVALGLCSYFPAFLRAPSRPVFGDAMGHYLSVENALRTGNLFASNSVVTVASDYPGLHSLTAALVELSGASAWHVGILLVAAFHVSTLLGIYAICVALGGGPRAAAAAAVIYSISPQFGFFDSQFAYESLAVPVLVWGVALTLYAIGEQRARPRSALLAAAGFAGLCCVVTHHLTSYMLAALLVVTGLAEMALRQRHRARLSAGLGLLVGCCAIGWIFATRAPIITYLGYFPRTAYDGIGPILHRLLGEGGPPTASGRATVTATRSLFSGSTLPAYEHYSAYLVQLVALVAGTVAAWRLRRRRSGALLTFALLGASYFVMLPLRLNLAGEQGANRVATFQWIGIAIVVATGFAGERAAVGPLPRAADVARRVRPLVDRPRWRVGAVVVLLLLCLVGNYGSAVNAAQRFPGAFELDSTDGRDAPAEAVRLAERFLHAEGPDRVVAADFSTARLFETYAYTTVGDAFPVWQFFSPDYSSTQLQYLAYSGRVTAIVIDDRLVGEGGVGGRFPGYPPADRPPITPAVLHRLSSFDWLAVMYRTEHYTVLRVRG